MQLSRRLQRVAANVLSGGVVADIGCDHGFTSIYLVSGGQAASAIAMDINPGPLQRATEHVQSYGMQNQIQIRLSDGTQALRPGEADTILISGMGGGLIERILRQNPDVTGSARELVLSPQSEIFRVRKTLHDMGFQIASEEMISDMGKYYVIIRAVPGKENYFREDEYIYGKYLIDQRNPLLQEFLEKELVRICGILERFPEDRPDLREEKTGALRKEYAGIKELLSQF